MGRLPPQALSLSTRETFCPVAFFLDKILHEECEFKQCLRFSRF